MKLYAALLVFVGSLAQAAVYKLDPSHSQVGFTVKHLMVSNVRGTFKKYDGKFDFDPAKKELKNIVVNIDTASIDTADGKRDDHLRSPDFFDAKKYPTITFKSDKGEFLPDGKTVKVPGTLTMRDKSKPITLDVTYNGESEFMGTKKIGFSATTKLNRQDFGVSWNKTLDKGGTVVGDEVTITIEGEADLDATKPVKK